MLVEENDLDVFNINKFYNLTFRITFAFPLFFLNI